MIKRLLSVLCLTLLLLVLASVATTRAAPQAGYFGQTLKPGFTVEKPGILAYFQTKWNLGWGGYNSVLRYSILNANRRGQVGFASSRIGARMLYTATDNSDCGTTPSAWKNAATLSGLAFPNGLSYKPNTITNINSLTPTFVYTPVAPSWPAVYSPTFNYFPQGIECLGVEGLLPPYLNGYTKRWVYSWP
jgi:hypothetical protein